MANISSLGSKMRNIFSFDCREHVRHVVKKMLKDDYGIKVPKDKPPKLQVGIIIGSFMA